MYSCQIVSPPSAKAMGIEIRLNARPRSPTIRIGRRRSRSTQTPAGRLRKMNGKNSIVPRRANSNGVTRRIVAATRGRARRVTCVPKTLTVSAVQSLRKSRCLRRLGRVAVGEDKAHLGVGGEPGFELGWLVYGLTRVSQRRREASPTAVDPVGVTLTVARCIRWPPCPLP